VNKTLTTSQTTGRTKTMRITKSVVDKLTPPPCKPDGKASQVIFRDSTIIGFGIRITCAGAKSFIVEKRIHGKSRRKTPGPYGPLTVETARKEAMKLLVVWPRVKIVSRKKIQNNQSLFLEADV
jgi:hypothetical protein